MNHIYDYIVIGAGISGLQSIEVLSKKTSNVIVLESQENHGGRVLSESICSLPGAMDVEWVKEKQDFFKDIYIEKGATWIEEQHTYILELCKKFGISIREQNSEGMNLYLHKDESLDDEELSRDERFGPRLREFVDQIDNLSKLYNREVLTVSENHDKLKSNRLLSSYDAKIVSEFLEENIFSNEARELIDNFLEHTECVSCDENSMHEVLTKHARSNDVGILKEFLGDYGHEASYLVNGGSSVIINKLVESIESLRQENRENFIFYNQQVITVDNKRSDFCVITTRNNKTGQKNMFKCRKVICSVPLAVSRSITFTNISKSKRFIFDNQLRTSCIKSFLIAKKPYWRSFASGEALFSSEHLVNMAHDISPDDLSCGIMVFFHSGKKFMEWESRFKNEESEYEARKQYIIDLTCKLFRFDEYQKQEYFSDSLYYISTFMDEPSIRSGFQSNTSPGTFTNIAKLGEGYQAFNRDENNIIFVGSEYSEEYASYMEGAIRVARKKCFNEIGESDDLFCSSVRESEEMKVSPEVIEKEICEDEIKA